MQVIYLGVIILESKFQLSSSSNNSNKDELFSSNFCHQEGSGTIISNIQSYWADQYGSIDTWNIKISPLLIILWQNILEHLQVALNFLLTTLPNRNFYCDHCRCLILYCSKIRKNTENSEQTENRQTENSITEATLIPVDCRGEWANILEYYDTQYYTMDCVPWTQCQLSRIPGNRQE